MNFTEMTHNEMIDKLRLCECALSAAVKDRDGLREQLEGWKKVAQEAEKVRDLALTAQHEATLARVKAEQWLTEERNVSNRLRTQVCAMCAEVASAYGRFEHLDKVLELAHDPDGTENTNPWHACARDLWRVVKAAMKGGGI